MSDQLEIIQEAELSDVEKMKCIACKSFKKVLDKGYCNEYNKDIEVPLLDVNCGNFDEKPNASKIIRKAFEDYTNHLKKNEFQRAIGEAAQTESDIRGLQNKVYGRMLSKEVETRWEASEIMVNVICGIRNIYTIRTDDKREMWIYHEGIYIPQGESYVKEFVRNVLGKAYKTRLCNDVLSKIEADTFIESDTFFNQNNIDELCLENGILNLRTKILTPFDSKKIFFNKIPVEYDPKKKCPAIDKHFETVLKHKEDVNVMYELFGFLLWKDYFIEKAFMFLGDGRNGKSKTLDLMKKFIGVDNCSDISIDDLQTDAYALGELFGKMANISGDINKTALKNAGNFKKATGRDLLGARRKFLNRLNFVNYAKMVFCANELPKIWEDTDAMWRRWLLFEFPFTFVGDVEYERLGEDKGNFRLGDPNIIEAITTPNELSGLLNKALDALRRIHKKGDFSYSKNTAEVRKMWIRKSDSFTCFMMDKCEKKYDALIVRDELSQEYSKYCFEGKLVPVSQKSIRATLERLGAWETRKSFEVGGTQMYVWNGWRLK